MILMFAHLLTLMLTTGCATNTTDSGSAAAECATIDPTDVTWNTWAQGFFMTWCQACHSATAENRHGAPTGTDFDTEKSVMEWRERIVTRVLEDQSMPLGGGLSSDDLALLQRYFDNVSCP